MNLGVVAVTYNSADHIGSCLAACEKNGLFESADVLVVDNASTDRTVEEVRRFPSVRLLANSTNKGFAGAVNQGIRHLDSELILILNPDARLETSVEAMIGACRQPGVGASGGRLLDENGRAQIGFQVRRFPTPASLAFEVLGINRIWPANPVNRKYRCLNQDPSVAASVEQPAGAFLMVRREVWASLGGFDETFHPLWFEDVDFLRRTVHRGWTVRYVPDSIATHTGGHSVASLGDGDRQIAWYGSLIRYAVRHFNPLGRWLVVGAVLLGVALRTATGMVQERSTRRLAVCGKIFQITVSSLFKREVRDTRGPSHDDWQPSVEPLIDSHEESIRRRA